MAQPLNSGITVITNRDGTEGIYMTHHCNSNGICYYQVKLDDCSMEYWDSRYITINGEAP